MANFVNDAVGKRNIFVFIYFDLEFNFGVNHFCFNRLKITQRRTEGMERKRKNELKGLITDSVLNRDVDAQSEWNGHLIITRVIESLERLTIYSTWFNSKALTIYSFQNPKRQYRKQEHQ